MTTPNGPVIFNLATGSDSAASGLGPATAESGAGAVFNSTAVVTGITTTGVSAGDMFFGDTSSGRKWSIIASVDSGVQVTCDTAFTVTESSRNWGIGGKRSDLDAASNRELLGHTAGVGAEGDLTLQFEDDPTATATIIVRVPGRITLQSNSSTRRIFINTANSDMFGPDSSSGGTGTIELVTLHFQNTNVSKTAADAVNISATQGLCYARNCIFGDATNTLRSAARRTGGSNVQLILENCEIKDCTGSGLQGASTTMIRCFGTYIHDCDIGIQSQTNLGAIKLDSCVIVDNTNEGVTFGDTTPGDMDIKNCVMANNGADGLEILGTSQSTASTMWRVVNNQFTGNGGFGFNIDTVTFSFRSPVFIDFNNYGFGADAYGGANTSGDVTGFTKGVNSTNLDPGYTDTASADFSVDTGQKAIGWPDSAVAIGAGQSGTFSFVDIGPQREEPESVMGKVVRSRFRPRIGTGGVRGRRLYG